MTINENLGNKIRELRTKAKLSQEAVGQALGKSHATISDIERGKTDLTITDLLLLADLFNTTIFSFFDNIKFNYTLTFENQFKNTEEANTIDLKTDNNVPQNLNYLNKVY